MSETKECVEYTNKKLKEDFRMGFLKEKRRNKKSKEIHAGKETKLVKYY